VILDWFARVVRDQPFLGNPVMQGGAVYVTGEGQGGLAKRVAAVAAEFEMSATDTFLYMRVMPRLLYDQEVKDFIAAVKLLTAHWTVPIRIIGFDTFNRAIVGGSESEGKDVAKLLDADNRIKEAFSCATMYAHHPGKAEGNFSRGHSSFQGDPDVNAAFSGKSGTRTIEIKKQKDDEDGNVIGYSLRQVRLGSHIKTGEPVTTCVVDWVEGAPRQSLLQAVEQRAHLPARHDYNRHCRARH
jgi:RecA-family ATPase